jgi:hypothetical protein
MILMFILFELFANKIYALLTAIKGMQKLAYKG